jgi:ATP-dependent Clp protease protease subunit
MNPDHSFGPADDFAGVLHGRLFERRVVSVFGHLDEAAVSRVAAELWSLDALGDEPIRLLLSLSGGGVDAAATLIDVLDVIGVEVTATCLGGISGPAVAVLAAAGRRVAAPSARFLLRDEPVSFTGPFRDLARAAEEHHARRMRLLGRLAESTHGRRSLGDVIADFERGLSMGAEEALAYGLVDHVEQPRDGVVSLLRRPPGLGFRPGGRR